MLLLRQNHTYMKKQLQHTDKSANVKDKHKSIERSHRKGTEYSKQYRVAKCRHTQGHTHIFIVLTLFAQ